MSIFLHLRVLERASQAHIQDRLLFFARKSGTKREMFYNGPNSNFGQTKVLQSGYEQIEKVFELLVTETQTEKKG